MKTILLFALMILGCRSAVGQNIFNRAIQENNERPHGALLNRNSHLYFCTISLDVASKGCYLNKYGPDGGLKLKTKLLFTPYAGLISKDNELIFAASQFFCDDMIPQDHSVFLTKTDSAGNVIWLTAATVPFHVNPRGVAQLSDSGYIMITKDILFRYDKAGQLLTTLTSTVNSVFSNINAVHALPNNNFLMSAGSGPTASLVIATATGSVLSSVSAQALLDIKLYQNNRIIALGSDGKLYKFSPALQALGNSSFTFLLRDFVIADDTIHGIGSTSTSPEILIAADTSFTSLSQFTTATSSYSQNVISDYGSRLAILGQSQSGSTIWQPKHYFTSLSVVAKNGDNNFSHDISIAGFSVDSSYSVQFGFPGYGYVFMRPLVKVKNMGTTVIKNFRVNCYLIPHVSCGAYVMQDSVTNVNLAPGDSMNVLLTKFAYKETAKLTGPGMAPVQFCFYTTLPNGETDKVYENNEFCATHSHLITGLKETEQEGPFFGIYPNPAQTSVAIRSSVELKKVEVFNQLGMLVYQDESQGLDYTCDISELEAGVYFVKCTTGYGMHTRKLIKN